MSYHTAPARQHAHQQARPATVDALLADVLSLPPARLGDFFELLVGRPEVAEAGWRVAERRLGQRRFADRDAEILRRHQEGRSYGELALDYGLSRTAIFDACTKAREESVRVQIVRTAASN